MAELAASQDAGDVLTALGLGSCVGVALLDGVGCGRGAGPRMLPDSRRRRRAAASRRSSPTPPCPRCSRRCCARARGAPGCTRCWSAARRCSPWAAAAWTSAGGTRPACAGARAAPACRCARPSQAAGRPHVRVYIGTGLVTCKEAGGAELDVPRSPAANLRRQHEQRRHPLQRTGRGAGRGREAGPGRAQGGGRARRTRRVREIDFSRPSKFAQDQQRRLERAHEAFCRTAATQLSAELLTDVEMEVLGVDQLTWSTAIGQTPQPSISAIVQANPLGTQFLMSTELSLVLRLVERLLGGPGSGKVRPRELTEIEMAIVRRVTARCSSSCRSSGTSWSTCASTCSSWSRRSTPSTWPRPASRRWC